MSRSIPNRKPVGSDYCLCPVEFAVPFIIVDHGGDCFWFHEPMDVSSAERLAFGIMNGFSAEAYRIDVKLILPAASDVRAVTDELRSVQSDPVRVKLRAEE